jgi:ribosomal protein S1
VSEKPAEDKLAQDIDRAIEELEAAARALDAPEVRRTLRALSDAAKAVATIQDAVKAVALQDPEKGVIFQDRLSAPSVQDALKAVAIQDAVKAVALQDAAKAVAIQDAVKAVVSSTSSVALRELVTDEVKRALALSGQAAQQAGDQGKDSK